MLYLARASLQDTKVTKWVISLQREIIFFCYRFKPA
jgi:hypothetical protein